MRIQSCSLAYIATAVCISAATQCAAADEAPGVVRISDRYTAPVQQASFSSGSFLLGHHHRPDGCADGCAAPETCCPAPVGCEAPAECCPAPVGCQAPAECCPAPVGCGAPAACAQPVTCAAPAPCCEAPAPEGCCQTEGCRGEGCDIDCETCNGCGCGCCGNGGSSGLLGHLFGGRRSRCSCDSCDYCGKGRSVTLFDRMFGCMSPSGACGQGAPLIGKYRINYANRPAYSDPRDGQAWAAQGYGMPVTVPTAPVVRYTYNYSHGTPASRLTPLSTYNPSTAPQSLFLQSW